MGGGLKDYDCMKKAIDQAERLEIPYLCLDPEVVNLQSAYQQFRFLTNCASTAEEFFIAGLWGCLDSGLL